MSSTTTINGVVYTIITGTGPFELLDWTGAGSPTNFMINGFSSVALSALPDQTTITRVLIGNTVTSIGIYAFYGTFNLISVSFESNSQLATIGEGAFSDTIRLTTIAIPDSVTSIGTYAFRNTTSLTSITFGVNSQLTSIGSGTFDRAIALTTIAIPDTVTSIGYGAFYRARGLNSITFGENSKLNTIGDYVFDETTSLTTIAIPDTVTTIGYAAFRDTTSLTSVNFGANSQLTSIEDLAFYQASALTSITIPNGVTNIGPNAFYKTALTTIAIPDTVTSIGYDAFRYATSLTRVYLTEDLTIDGTTYAIGTSGSFFGAVNVSFEEPPLPPQPICFPSGTPVTTDQGQVAIEKLNPDKHTIRGKEIVAITQTRPLQKHIVCFEKDALSKNVPSQQTLCSKNHKIFYKGEMIKARNIVDMCENVTFVDYNGETLYNVLLKKHDKMMVNNLICETLHPKNIMAKISTMKDGQQKNKVIQDLTKIIKENNIPEYQKLYTSL